jgi:GTP cyclohydrolase II
MMEASGTQMVPQAHALDQPPAQGARSRPPAALDDKPQRNPRVDLVATCKMQTPWAEFELHGFAEPGVAREHLALTLGSVADGEPVLLRLHSECLTGDALFSQRCDCGAQLEAALQEIAHQGRGVLLYLRQEGRGIGLLNKIRAYRLQDNGADTVDANHRLGFPADLRDYAVGAAVLERLGVHRVRLMTNNPHKLGSLQRLGVAVVERVPLKAGWSAHNARYLRTKAARLGHTF